MKAPWIQLAQAVCFAVSGKDARRYLHNRLSHDIRALHPGGSLQAAALSSQGRVEGLFSVCCESDERFVLIADGGEPDALKDALARYIVADRVHVEALAPVGAVLHIGLPPAEVDQQGLVLDHECVGRVECRRISESGVSLIVQGDHLKAAYERCRTTFGEPLTVDQYYISRWKAGIPAYPSELSEQVILTECGMREAVSFTKGCYVGQEVIERSDAVGRLPRTLERIVFKGGGLLTKGATVVRTGDGISLGKIVSGITDSRSADTFTFALLKTGTYSHQDVVQCEGLFGSLVSSAHLNKV